MEEKQYSVKSDRREQRRAARSARMPTSGRSVLLVLRILHQKAAQVAKSGTHPAT